MSEEEKETRSDQVSGVQSSESSFGGSWLHATKDDLLSLHQGKNHHDSIPILVPSPDPIRRRSFIDMANVDSLSLNDAAATAAKTAPNDVPTLSNINFAQTRPEAMKPAKVGKHALRLLCIGAMMFSLRAFMHQHLKLTSLQRELGDMKDLNRALQSTSGVAYDNDVKLLLDEVEYQEEYATRLENKLHETRTFLAMHMMRHYKSELDDKFEDEKFLYALYFEAGNRLKELLMQSDQAKRVHEMHREDQNNDEEFLYAQYNIAVQQISELELKVEDKADDADFLYSQYYKALDQIMELRKELEQVRKEHVFELEDKNNDEEFLYEQYYEMKQELSKVKEENKLNNHRTEIIERDYAYLQTKIRDQELNAANAEADIKKLVLALAQMKKENLRLRQENFNLSQAATAELKTPVETKDVDYEELSFVYSQLQESSDLAMKYKAQHQETQTQMTALQQKYDEVFNQTVDEEEVIFVYSQLQQVNNVAMDLKTQLKDAQAQLTLLRTEYEILHEQYDKEELDFTYSQLHQTSDVAKKYQAQLTMTQSALTALQQTNKNLVKHSQSMAILLHLSQMVNQELKIEDEEITFLYSQLENVSNSAQNYKVRWEETQMQLSALQEQYQTTFNDYDEEELAFAYSEIQRISKFANEELHMVQSQLKVQKEQYEHVAKHSLALEMLLHFSYMAHQSYKAEYTDVDEEIAFVYSQLSISSSSAENCQEQLKVSHSKREELLSHAKSMQSELDHLHSQTC